MSLEEALGLHTKALEANTAAILRHNEILSGLGKKTGAIADSDSDKKADAKSDSKSDAKADKADKGEGKRTRATKEKVPAVSEMKEKAEAFLNIDDEDEYANRRKNLKAIVTYFNAPKFTEIDAVERALALKLLEVAKSGEFDPDNIEGEVAALEGDKGDAKPSSRRRDDDDI